MHHIQNIIKSELQNILIMDILFNEGVDNHDMCSMLWIK